MSLGTIIRSFKSEATRQYKRRTGFEGELWQRNYYEHVIRNEAELGRVREYILLNPLKWDLDHNNNLDRRRDPTFEKEWEWLEPGPPEPAASKR